MDDNENKVSKPRGISQNKNNDKLEDKRSEETTLLTPQLHTK